MGAVVLWDFDGTLAWREGLWSGCVLEVLDEHEPGHGASLEAIRSRLKGGFPWHRHERPHPELADPDAWWLALAPLICGAMAGAGVAETRARELCAAVRERFVDGARAWHLFDDTRAALSRVREAGRQNVVVSNHVPELDRLVAALGLDDLLDDVFSSALTGYEKPHPEAFRTALRGRAGSGDAWMVGDNPHADVAGAEAIGIPAILVRTAGGCRHTAPDAAAAAELLLAAPQAS
ncbi:MAG TPA: HAD family hydrolase [Solirubrobacteraceae bacterium]|nr:HAD family hydrolase [Solirubrobacteraceae bacterium]